MNIRNEDEMRIVQKSYAKVQSLYWTDERFRSNLKENPAGALKKQGILVGEVDKIEVLVNDDKNAYLVLPAQPANMRLSEVNHIAAEGTFGTGGTVGSAGTICGCAATFGTLGTFGCSEL